MVVYDGSPTDHLIELLCQWQFFITAGLNHYVPRQITQNALNWLIYFQAKLRETELKPAKKHAEMPKGAPVAGKGAKPRRKKK